MAKIEKFHVENSARVAGTSLCGQKRFSSPFILSQTEFERLPHDRQCAHCQARLNGPIVSLKTRRLFVPQDNKALAYVD
jgi:hypothetical protein